MKHFGFSLSVILLGIFCQQVNATTIHVPADSATIQGAVNGAEHGDTILVAPGVYNENVSCTCKAILLASHYLFDHDTLTIDSTIIDGEGGVALDFLGWNCFPEEESLTVIGFTVCNSGEGIDKAVVDYLEEPRSKTRIRYCNFANNVYGIHTRTDDECVIDHNLFMNNHIGVACWGGIVKNEERAQPGCCTTIVENNVFLFNSWEGAVSVGGAYQIFRNNIFSENRLGISVSWLSSLNAVNNVVYNNDVGIHCGSWEDIYCVTVENNIIAANDTGMYIWGSVDSAGTGDTAWGTNFNGTSCDAFYNIMRNPLFADTIDFELLCNSPCIDAGDSTVPVPDSGGYWRDIGKNEFHYLIGDASGDLVVDIGDVIFTTNHVFIGGAEPCPFHSGDVNCDGVIDAGDVVCLINYLFLGHPIPCS